MGINQNSAPSVLYRSHRGQENPCAISVVEKTYFLVRYLLFTVYLLAKYPVNRGGGSANITELQQQGQLAWGYVIAGPGVSQKGSGIRGNPAWASVGAASGGHNSRLRSLSVDSTLGMLISARGVTPGLRLGQ